MQENTEQRQSIDRLDHHKKAGLVILIVLAFLVVVFWIWQFEQKVYAPFYPQDLENQNSVCVNCQTENDLLKRDTDGDGLNDWEELNNYYTSPYLEDTDGDGINDKDEIDQETDPNCYLGQDCYGDNPLLNEEGSGGVSSVTTVTTDISLEEQYEEYEGSPDSWASVLEGQADSQSLRQALLDFGADPSFLRQVSDEDLMATYRGLAIEAGIVETETATSTEE